MKNTGNPLLMLALAFSVFTGCYSTLDGRVRPGVPFAKDRIVSRYERPVDQILDAAKDVLNFNGNVVGENRINNTLQASIDTRTVYVKVSMIDVGLTQVDVQARNKGGISDIDLASEIDKQIALRLR